MNKGSNVYKAKLATESAFEFLLWLNVTSVAKLVGNWTYLMADML